MEFRFNRLAELGLHFAGGSRHPTETDYHITQIPHQRGTLPDAGYEATGRVGNFAAHSLIESLMAISHAVAWLTNLSFATSSIARQAG